MVLSPHVLKSSTVISCRRSYKNASIYNRAAESPGERAASLVEQRLKLVWPRSSLIVISLQKIYSNSNLNLKHQLINAAHLCLFVTIFLICGEPSEVNHAGVQSRTEVSSWATLGIQSPDFNSLRISCCTLGSPIDISGTCSGQRRPTFTSVNLVSLRCYFLKTVRKCKSCFKYNARFQKCLITDKLLVPANIDQTHSNLCRSFG